MHFKCKNKKKLNINCLTNLGVSPEEIDADELDRHLFSARFTDKEASEVKREPTSRGPFGIAPSAHDLGKIMELRKNFVWPEEDGSTIFSDVE